MYNITMHITIMVYCLAHLLISE